MKPFQNIQHTWTKATSQVAWVKVKYAIVQIKKKEIKINAWITTL